MTRWVAMDGPLPGIGPWDQITNNPRLWHFGFGGPHMERLVSGRERVYLDHFWNDLSVDAAVFNEEMREHYGHSTPARRDACRLCAVPSLRADVVDNKSLLKRGKLTVPVLAVGGEASTGAMAQTLMQLVSCSDVGGLSVGRIRLAILAVANKRKTTDLATPGERVK